MQVFPDRGARILGLQNIVGQAKHTRGKQVVAVAVLGKGARLPHQPVDHVPIVDAVLVPPAQARLPLDQVLGIPDFHVLGVQAHLDLFADQPAGYRVAIALHMDHAAWVHATAAALTRFQPPRRQRPQPRPLLGQPPVPAGV